MRSIARAQKARSRCRPRIDKPKLLATSPRRSSTASWVGLGPQALGDPGPARLADLDLPMRTHRHRERSDRQPGPGDARVPRRLRARSDRDRAQVRTLAVHRVRERLRAFDRRRGRYRSVNGIPIVGHQGPGSITDVTIRRLLLLQGSMKPHQIISLMTFPGADNTLALPSHYNHIHVGFRPANAFGNPLRSWGPVRWVGPCRGRRGRGRRSRGATGGGPAPYPLRADREEPARPPAGRGPEAAAAAGRARPRRHRARPPAAATPHGPAPHLRFTIQPASAAAPLIDPAPVLDGWRMRERTSLYRGRAPHPSIGQALLMDPATLGRLVLADRRITIYDCGRADVANGQIDGRILGALELLADAGLRPSVSRLACGHPAGAGGAAYVAGDAVDITTLDRTPVRGHQGAGLGHRPRDSPAARAPGADQAEPDREPAVVP